jgi:hypothetical protein
MNAGTPSTPPSRRATLGPHALRSIIQDELVSDAEVSLRSLSANKAAKRSAKFGVTVSSGRQASMGNASNRAASSSAMRTSRRIRRAESFASNFLRKAAHLAHVSVPGWSRNSTWSRQNSSRRSQCWRGALNRRSRLPVAACLRHERGENR